MSSTSERTSSERTRVDSNNGHSSPVFGRVYWSPAKSIWMTLITMGAVFGGYSTFSWQALLLCLVTSFVILSVGYSVGIHHRLIHNSFQCSQWLENTLVYIGVLGSTVGPYSAIEQHDLHDWARQQPRCHSYFAHSQNPVVDWVWTMHCDIQLAYPPIIHYEPQVANNSFYWWLEQTKLLHQLPLAIAFYHFGGWSWVFWGIYVRICICANAQWLMQYRAQSWQNHHQVSPYSARFNHSRNQYAPGWWIISALRSAGLAWNIEQPKPLASAPRHSLIEPAIQPAAQTQTPQI
ncbi:MAG: hypothetical protein WA783_04820 [Phormidesmis sp.]